MYVTTVYYLGKYGLYVNGVVSFFLPVPRILHICTRNNNYIGKSNWAS